MNNLKIFKRKSFIRNVHITDTQNTYMQPFRQMPSENSWKESADRINAHELFSHYTAEIIKEDTIFTR